MATETINYGTASALSLGTTPNSLANGSAGQSPSVDNTTTKADDYAVEVKANALAGNTGVVNIWVAPSIDGGTSYADGATGTAGTFTAANRKNAVWLGQINLNGATAQQGMMRQTVAMLYGGVCPAKFAFIYTNDSGAALAASGFAITVMPIKWDIA